MKKIILCSLILMLFGCISNETIKVKRVKNKMKYQLVEDNLHFLYGGGYKLVKKDDKYVLETFGGYGEDTELSEIYEKRGFTITTEYEIDENHFEKKRIYYYETDNEKIEIYSCPGFTVGNETLYKYPNVFALNGIAYFSYFENNYIVVNEVKDKEIVEIFKMPVMNNEYELENYIHEHEHMFVYKGDNIKYIIGDEEYIFNNSDRVIVLKDYIFYTSYDNEKATKSYLINRKNKEIKELNNIIDFDKEEFMGSSSLGYINQNCFMFVENDDETKYFTYAQVLNDQIKLHRLSLEVLKEHMGYTPWYSFTILNEKDLCIIRQNYDGTFGYHIYVLK